MFYKSQNATRNVRVNALVQFDVSIISWYTVVPYCKGKVFSCTVLRIS